MVFMIRLDWSNYKFVLEENCWKVLVINDKTPERVLSRYTCEMKEFACKKCVQTIFNNIIIATPYLFVKIVTKAIFTKYNSMW